MSKTIYKSHTPLVTGMPLNWWAYCCFCRNSLSNATKSAIDFEPSQSVNKMDLFTIVKVDPGYKDMKLSAYYVCPACLHSAEVVVTPPVETDKERQARKLAELAYRYGGNEKTAKEYTEAVNIFNNSLRDLFNQYGFSTPVPKYKPGRVGVIESQSIGRLQRPDCKVGPDAPNAVCDPQGTKVTPPSLNDICPIYWPNFNAEERRKFSAALNFYNSDLVVDLNTFRRAMNHLRDLMAIVSDYVKDAHEKNFVRRDVFESEINRLRDVFAKQRGEYEERIERQRETILEKNITIKSLQEDYTRSQAKLAQANRRIETWQRIANRISNDTEPDQVM